MSGAIINEFYAYPETVDKFPLWVRAIQRVIAEHPDRAFYPYISGDPKGLLPFVKPLFESGCRFAYERYLGEQPTEEAAKKFIEKKLRDEVMVQLSRGAPGVEKAIIFVLGIGNGPPETLDTNPATSFNVYLDMQLHLLANDPAFRGLYGVEVYRSSYADEGCLRWMMKLYRHYCIEGRTEPLTHDPYELNHIQNPDFEHGMEGWTVAAAQPGSVGVKKMDGFGFLEGRERGGQGDSFLWTKRSAAKPNVISQKMRNLQPGRVYSLRMYAGDYLELTREQKHAISLRVEGVELIENKCFQTVFKCCADHHIPKYGNKDTYFNFFRLVFRAKSETANLTISDWPSEKGPTGPVGQELMYNFVEVEPYLMDEEHQ
jgi:hypothetical protein